MKKSTIRTAWFALIFLFMSIYTFAQVPAKVGSWKFDDSSNLTKADIGSDLELVGNVKSIGGTTATDKAITIAKGSYFKLTHGISANGGGTKVNEYSLKFDFKVSNTNTWKTFFQTNPLNNDDGDCFINTSGEIGTQATGYGAYTLKDNEWYRLIISVQTGTSYKYFLDGQLLLSGTVQAVDDRFSLSDVLLLFADNDGDDDSIDVSEVAIWDKALSDADVLSLGGYGHDLGGGNSSEPALVGNWKFDDASNLLKAEVGNPLELVGTQDTVSGPTAGNGAVKIGVGSYLKMTHGISPNGGGLRVNEYSIQIDFKIPALDNWHCFYQTTPANTDDGDCFINTAGNIGVGVTGYSSYSVKTNEWYRLIVSVKNGSQYKYYLDGNLLLDGTVQTVDGRFSLDNVLLMFADNDGEDAEIDCAEISIWNYALTANEVNALGGYGHKIKISGTQQLVLVPYLQTPQPTSIYVCWHDTLATLTKVEYGTTEALGQSTDGTSEIISSTYRWHTVKLTGLQPNTEYFYKAVSGSGSSLVYSFKTLPDANFTGKIRFLLLSDTHSTDTTMAVKVIKEAKKKIQELYGDDIQNHLNMVLHSGDLVVDGHNIINYTDQYFAPMSTLSPNIPFMTVTGNHEAENPIYYRYMKYDDFSDYPNIAALNEKFWSFTTGGTMFIGLNSNVVSSLGNTQKDWLEQKLKDAEADSYY